MIHTTEKTIKDLGDKVSAADKEAIEREIGALKTGMEAEDLSVIKEKTESLMQASMKLGEAMYKQQQAEQPQDGAQSGPHAGAKDDGVVDADFEEVK